MEDDGATMVQQWFNNGSTMVHELPPVGRTVDLMNISFDQEAIRESLVNAVVHRDYSNDGRDIKIGIYDDIVNIVSPGGFPSTITQEDILEGRSEIRNKLIARVFNHNKKINITRRSFVASCYRAKQLDFYNTMLSGDAHYFFPFLVDKNFCFHFYLLSPEDPHFYK